MLEMVGFGFIVLLLLFIIDDNIWIFKLFQILDFCFRNKSQFSFTCELWIRFRSDLPFYPNVLVGFPSSHYFQWLKTYGEHVFVSPIPHHTKIFTFLKLNYYYQMREQAKWNENNKKTRNEFIHIKFVVCCHTM